jgi:hypothetical protein
MRVLKALVAVAVMSSAAVACASPYDDYYGSGYSGSGYGYYQPANPYGYYGSRYASRPAYYGPQYSSYSGAPGPQITIAASF